MAYESFYNLESVQCTDLPLLIVVGRRPILLLRKVFDGSVTPGLGVIVSLPLGHLQPKISFFTLKCGSSSPM